MSFDLGRKRAGVDEFPLSVQLVSDEFLEQLSSKAMDRPVKYVLTFWEP